MFELLKNQPSDKIMELSEYFISDNDSITQLIDSDISKKIKQRNYN